MLIPDSNTPAVRDAHDWAQEQRAHGRQVIGFNAHPMLIKNPTHEQLTHLFGVVAAALDRFMAGTNVAVALISHDYRGASGDDVCLKPIAGMLQTRFGDRLYYSETKCTAAELKGISGAMDGVVTGRMHLAIASLGMGVPVAALTYQDKFQGLMRHFELPQDLLLAPEQLVEPTPLIGLLQRFTNDIAKHKVQVGQRLATVKKMSAKNVHVLLG
jgi:polysaccharide pyruvyl transferase WcaK-like protein